MPNTRVRLGDITGKDTLAIRNSLGLTQREFAGRLGLFSVIPISRWENLKARPSIGLHKKLRKLAAEARVVLSCDE